MTTDRRDAAAIGRPMRVTALSFGDVSVETALAVADREAAKGTDLLVLPETYRGQTDQTMEPLDGPSLPAFAELARKHNTYVVLPIDRVDSAGRRFNTAVLIDRAGAAAGVYDKVFPVWMEFDHRLPVQPGRHVAVFQADFGRLGLAICFDCNFPRVWDDLAAQDAEIVVWPSAYKGGLSLQAHAINHHYYVVTATKMNNVQVFDITGERILDERGEDGVVARVTLDLDRGIYHLDYNQAKLPGFLEKHGKDVLLEKTLADEGWFVLRARRPGVSARELARQAGLEELRTYLRRSREINPALSS